MGNFWENSSFPREQVISDVEQVNKITSNQLFVDRTKLLIKFVLDDSSIINKSKRKIILAKLYSYNPDTQALVEKPSKRLEINDFYKFNNDLMNCLPIFYSTQIKNKIEKIKKSRGEEDDDATICSICFLEKVSVQLPCGHFFCKPCIDTWAMKKNDSCPMCRYKIEVDTQNGKIKEATSWDVVDNESVNKAQMDKENEEIFFMNMTKLFG